MNPIKAAVLGKLGPSPTAAQRRAMQALLLELAEEQERLAIAQERLIRWRVASRLADAAKPTGRPAGRGGSFVRFEPRPERYERGGCWLHLSAQVYRLLEQPERIAFRLLESGAIHIQPAIAPLGYAMQIARGPRGGNPRIGIGINQATALGLVVGRMPVEVDDAGRVLILPIDEEGDPHGG